MAAMQAATVSIEGLDKVEVLRALWHAQNPAGFFEMTGAPSPTFEDPSSAILRLYIDYHCGRAIKANLSGNSFNPFLFDRDAGAGAAARAIAALRVATTEAGRELLNA